MNLECYFNIDSKFNSYLSQLYESIFERLVKENPSINFWHIYHHNGISLEMSRGILPMHSSLIVQPLTFQIINPKNYKAIFLSFADRGLDCIESMESIHLQDRWDNFWKTYDVVQYIGGLGMYMSDEYIVKNYNLNRCKFQPYLSSGQHSDGYFNQYAKPYSFDNKKRRICFYGSGYYPRADICELLKKHPLFHIVLCDDNKVRAYRQKEYYKNISDSRIGLSLNGAGEVSMRDFEYFGLRVPSIRPKLNTQFYHEIVPDKHYISVDLPSHLSWFTYDLPTEEIADRIINVASSIIDDYDTLKLISDNAYEYNMKYLQNEYLVELFFRIVDLNLLK